MRFRRAQAYKLTEQEGKKKQNFGKCSKGSNEHSITKCNSGSNSSCVGLLSEDGVFGVNK